MSKYYIVETTYEGPNADSDRYIDARRVEIWTEPAAGNSSGEPILGGWCGTINDWSVTAHGAHESLEAAREAIWCLCGQCRRDEDPGPWDGHIVERYRPGQYEPFSTESTLAWLYESLRVDIWAGTADGALERLATAYRESARESGYELSSELPDLLDAHRTGQREDFLSKNCRQQLRNGVLCYVNRSGDFAPVDDPDTAMALLFD